MIQIADCLLAAPNHTAWRSVSVVNADQPPSTVPTTPDGERRTPNQGADHPSAEPIGVRHDPLWRAPELGWDVRHSHGTTPTPNDGSALVKRAVVGDVESRAMAHARQRDAHRTLRAGRVLERQGKSRPAASSTAGSATLRVSPRAHPVFREQSPPFVQLVTDTSGSMRASVTRPV
jgi:hypothetical protein